MVPAQQLYPLPHRFPAQAQVAFGGQGQRKGGDQPKLSLAPAVVVAAEKNARLRLAQQLIQRDLPGVAATC